MKEIIFIICLLDFVWAKTMSKNNKIIQKYRKSFCQTYTQTTKNFLIKTWQNNKPLEEMHTRIWEGDIYLLVGSNLAQYEGM